MKYCDLCGAYVDPLEQDGTYDDEQDIYSCEKCCDNWQETVTGVKPARSALRASGGES